ncbi:hypothetical protein D0868_10732 [Hortaea werneckii]|uniref:Uncharacterized protein n=1 Tax=Hortaea werneckii TaxID=91943 RepID=A0A3M6Y2L4_HORWE|nr:hypothetical protein D0868_10732 [Hortaea werneckii]
MSIARSPHVVHLRMLQFEPIESSLDAAWRCNTASAINRTNHTRHGAGDKLASNLKPDSEKSTLEKGQDQVKGAADSLAGQAQPEDQKSYTQQATDAISNAGQQVSDTLGLSGGSKS